MHFDAVQTRDWHWKLLVHVASSASGAAQVPVSVTPVVLHHESMQLLDSYSLPPSAAWVVPHAPPAIDPRTQVPAAEHEVKFSQRPWPNVHA